MTRHHYLTLPINEVAAFYLCPDCGRLLLATWRGGWRGLVLRQGEAAVAHFAEAQQERSYESRNRHRLQRS